MKRLLVWLALLALCLVPCARAENAEPEFTIPPPGVSMMEKQAELEEQERLNATEPPPAYSQEQIDALPDEVFAQCDSYMAVLQDSTYPISFYLYYKGDAAFGGREVAGVAFPDAPGIEFYEVKTLEGEREKGDRFGALSVMTWARFHEAGRFEFDSVELTFSDGERKACPIGRFVVEVFADEDSDALFTYSTPALSSNPTELGCIYEKQAEDVAMHSLYMDILAGYETEIAENDGVYEMETTFTGGRPIVFRFILPRVEASVGGKGLWIYPKVGCYCGGGGITEERMLDAWYAWQENS